MNIEQNQGMGPLIGSIIIVLLLLVGGYYSLRTSNPATIPVPIKPLESQPGQSVQIITPPALPPQESTEIQDIEVDAKAVDLKNLDSELDNLDLLVR